MKIEEAEQEESLLTFQLVTSEKVLAVNSEETKYSSGTVQGNKVKKQH